MNNLIRYNQVGSHHHNMMTNKWTYMNLLSLGS
ncbi:unnamed protein product [Spirodela intermedia]|uniref:Uncharacterized protein n=1 Tax=Spirodela intermedia TaxID=51605 RepID=A0A7I8IJU4_SPIIN|nr:unnamed protein product [Spirodela intermedia]CAA6658149.1 unnamed protein product [Spirodela intermedia]